MSTHPLLSHPKPLIGVVHLPPLPGYASSPGISSICEQALEALRICQAEGLQGVLVENENDRPYRLRGTPETIAAMTAVTAVLVRAAGHLSIGCEILLNDPMASIAVASASGAGFIRTDYFVDRMSRPEYGGEMDIDPEGLLAYRQKLDAERVLVYADIQVKHAQCLEEKTLEQSAALAREHSADAIVVTGTLTGVPPSHEELARAKKGAGGIPVIVGSGLDARNAPELLNLADGAIVGTSLMKEGKIQPMLVRELVKAREIIL